MNETATSDARRFSLAYNRWIRLLLVLCRAGPRQTDIVIRSDTLWVRIGWIFRVEVPLSAIKATRLRSNPWWNLGLGVRTNLAGTWAISAAWTDMTQLDIEPTVVGHLFWGFPVGVMHLLVGLEDGGEFVRAIDELRGRGASSS